MRAFDYNRLPWVRLCREDHPDWLMLSWKAQAVYCLMLMHADSLGAFQLGRGGIDTIAGRIGHSGKHPDITNAVRELIDAGFVEYNNNTLSIVDYVKMQSAKASSAARKRKQRETTRAIATLARVKVPPQHHIAPDIRAAVFARDGNSCRYCGSSDRPTIDHVLPHSRGGSDDLSNLVVCCKRCNCGKKNRTPEEIGWTIRPLGRS